MIARFSLLLPFDLLIAEAREWTTIDLDSGDQRIRVYPPLFRAERPRPTDNVISETSSWLTTLIAPSFGEDVLVDGKKVAQVNVLTIDFIKPQFNRSDATGIARDPPPELAFDIANSVLAKLRVYSRVPQIKPLVLNRDPWHLSYLTDDLAQLEIEDGKIRGRFSGPATVGLVAITPEIMGMVVARWQHREPYLWDKLLLDAYALWPDVGTALVMAFSALELFIGWALDVLHEQHPLPPILWPWIKERDHWAKEPSVSEQFSSLLAVFTGRSLKEESTLWMQFLELKKARNSLVHEGLASIGKNPVDASKAKQLIDSAGRIIMWVELLLPDNYRRAKSKSESLSSKRLATSDQAATLGLTLAQVKIQDNPE